ncbi:MAG: hypothetical protein ACTSU2_07485 [Promethearchaeota archaeon]
MDNSVSNNNFNNNYDMGNNNNNNHNNHDHNNNYNSNNKNREKFMDPLMGENKNYLWKQQGERATKEIGLAISHYNQKLGPQFVGVAYNLSMFDNLTQYAILHDSLTSRSKELIMFIKNKAGQKYKTYVRKFNIYDNSISGGMKKYALLIILPQKIVNLKIDVNDIIEDFIEKMQNRVNIGDILKAWHILLNDLQGFISIDTEDPKIFKI